MENEHGIVKGVRTILQERQLIVSGMKLDDSRNILASKPDLMEQKNLLTETVERSGHSIIFYPKFHPEFNFIEMFWGACKEFTRKNCDYSWNTLQKTVPSALNSVSLPDLHSQICAQIGALY